MEVILGEASDEALRLVGVLSTKSSMFFLGRHLYYNHPYSIKTHVLSSGIDYKIIEGVYKVLEADMCSLCHFSPYNSIKRPLISNMTNEYERREFLYI
jgi:hypothetical protein